MSRVQLNSQAKWTDFPVHTNKSAHQQNEEERKKTGIHTKKEKNAEETYKSAEKQNKIIELRHAKRTFYLLCFLDTTFFSFALDTAAVRQSFQVIVETHIACKLTLSFARPSLCSCVFVWVYFLCSCLFFCISALAIRNKCSNARTKTNKVEKGIWELKEVQKTKFQKKCRRSGKTTVERSATCASAFIYCWLVHWMLWLSSYVIFHGIFFQLVVQMIFFSFFCFFFFPCWLCALWPFSFF